MSSYVIGGLSAFDVTAYLQTDNCCLVFENSFPCF